MSGPSDEAVCVRIAEEVGLPGSEFASALADPETERLAASSAEEAYRRGAFGVPTFFVDQQMFWGNDRIVLLRHLLTRRASGGGASRPRFKRTAGTGRPASQKGLVE